MIRCDVVKSSPLHSIIRYRELILATALREMKEFSKGAFLGLAWRAIEPLVQVGVYVIVICVVFGRGGAGAHAVRDQAGYILSGMIPWQLMLTVLREAPMLIRSRMELVKQVIYPIETLPVSTIIVNSIGSIVVLAVYVTMMLATGNISWTIVFLPIPIFVLILFLIGFSWSASIVGVVLKDLKEVIGIVMHLMVYLSPLVLRPEMVGEKIWWWILLNPLSHVIICFRDVLEGVVHPASWCVFVILTLSSLVLGSTVMCRAKILINEYI